MADWRSLAIIGGGFSGTLLAYHLSREALPGRVVTLVEREGTFGPGRAYATANSSHLLNASAGRHSVFSDRPRHFAEWLRQLTTDERSRVPATAMVAAYVSRRLYGGYLEETLASPLALAAADGRVELLGDEAVSIKLRGCGFVVRLARGRKVFADKVVLALGQGLPSPPRSADADVLASGLYIPDPFQPEALAEVGRDDPVCIVGTGLTMVDAVLSLQDQGHEGPILAVSRRGILPQAHVHDSGAAPREIELASAGPVDLLRAVRGIAHDETGWRGVVDGLRPLSSELWRGFAPGEKARFVRHLWPWWTAHRHRIAPESARRVTAALDSGQMRVMAGQIERVSHLRGRAVVTLRPRGGHTALAVPVARVIDCSGPMQSIRNRREPLLQSLFAQDLARPDSQHLGLDVDREGRVIAASGQPQPGLYAIGPLTSGTFGEITAVPEIRARCERLAGLLAKAGPPEPETWRRPATVVSFEEFRHVLAR